MDANELTVTVNIVIHKLRLDFLYASRRNVSEMQTLNRVLYDIISIPVNSCKTPIDTFLYAAINRAIWLGPHS